MPGHNGGFNPFRDKNGEFTEPGAVGQPGRSRAGGPTAWVALPKSMNAQIRAAAGKPVEAEPAKPAAFGADRARPEYKPAGYPLVTDGDFQALYSKDGKALEIWEKHTFSGFADPGTGRENRVNALAAITVLKAGVATGASARQAASREANTARAAAGQPQVYRELGAGDMQQFVREQTARFTALPAATKQLMVAFQETGALNTQIRAGRGNVAAVATLTGAMRPSEEALTLYRGVDARYLPPLKPGATLKVKEFSSTSITPDTAVSYARDGERPVVMKIRAPAGQPMLPMLREGRGVEMAMEEVLLPPGMTYKVVSVAPGPKGTTTVEVDIVPATS